MAVIIALIVVIIGATAIGTSRRYVQGESIFDLILFAPPKRMKLAQLEKLGEDKSLALGLVALTECFFLLGVLGKTLYSSI